MTVFEPVIDGLNDLVVNVLGFGEISVELADAWSLPPPTNPPAGLSRAQGQVLSWLQAHKADIVSAETKFRIDRRAVAGAIAWEALMNVLVVRTDGFGRSAGPGKVHYSTERTWGEGNPLSKQVEVAGYLPRVTMEKRRQLLRTAVGSATYIGACMAALADIAANHGFNIRCDPPPLCWAYQSRDLTSWESTLANRPAGTPLSPNTDPPTKSMGVWMKDPSHITYLEAGVGKFDPAICTPAFVGPP
jgi:hypothetical protein